MSKRKPQKSFNFNNEKNHVEIEMLRKFLKTQILCPETKFRHHINERAHVLDLVKRTIENGESNSLLLIGPRGSGKTTLINSVLRELSNWKPFKENATIVHLHGLVHTDDRLALKDATRQMQLENVVGDKVFGSFAENLTFLLECLKSGDKKKSKPVIFILDEFELFCAHNNQTLLYNLFDVSQSAQSPICVIGLTSRIDVIELLEKRVKSRFSHRQIFILPQNIPESEKITKLEDWMNLFRELLSLPDDENVNKIEQLQDDHCITPEFAKKWNAYILKLSEDQQMQGIIKNFQSYDVNERNFRHFLAVAITFLSENHPKLEISDFNQAQSMYRQDQKVLILEGLSILEFCLVIAMMHQTEIFGDDPIDFETVYNRYMQFANQSTIETVQRPVIIKAFEHLKNLELITPVAGNNQRVEKEYQCYNFMVTKGQVVEAVKKYNNLPTDVENWADNKGIM